MAPLPVNYGDPNEWGLILNEFLSVSLNPNTGAIQSAALQEALSGAFDPLGAAAAAQTAAQNFASNLFDNISGVTTFAGRTGDILPEASDYSAFYSAITSGVSSWNGRTGIVSPASGDYTVSQVIGAAPINAPTFTGVPAAPTASAGSVTTQLATTAFVAAAVTSGIVNIVNRTASGTAVAGEQTVVTGTTASQNVTLPNTPPTGTDNSVVNNSSVNWTINSGPSDTISHYETSGLIDIVIPPGMGISFAYLSGVWYVQPGTGFVPGMCLGNVSYVQGTGTPTITAAVVVSGTIVSLSATGTWIAGQAVTIASAAGGGWGTALNNGAGVSWQITTGGTNSFQIDVSQNGRAAPSGSYTASSGRVTRFGWITRNQSSTGLAAIDTTNLAFSFVVPPNGKVMTEVSADFAYYNYGLSLFDLFVGWVAHGTSTQVGVPYSVQGGFTPASGATGATGAAVPGIVGSYILGSRFPSKGPITGLTPGPLTLDLAFGCSATQTDGFGQLFASTGPVSGALAGSATVVSPLLMTAYALP